jgi:hypothetical protein
MTLRVPFEGFARAVQSVLELKEVFLHETPRGVILTAGKENVVVVTRLAKSKAEVAHLLHEQGLKVWDGLWSVDDDQELLHLPFVAAVSYRATSKSTGVWVNAFANEPTELDVLSQVYDEFRRTEAIPEMSLEQFSELAQVTIQIISPGQLEGFMEPNS